MTYTPTAIALRSIEEADTDVILSPARLYTAIAASLPEVVAQMLFPIAFSGDTALAEAATLSMPDRLRLIR
jgi:uncharacterized MnhB-related membrane protein